MGKGGKVRGGCSGTACATGSRVVGCCVEVRGHLARQRPEDIQGLNVDYEKSL